MNTVIMLYMWLWFELLLGSTLSLLVTMIIQHYKHIITHYEYVHNIDGCFKVPPRFSSSCFLFAVCVKKGKHRGNVATYVYLNRTK